MLRTEVYHMSNENGLKSLDQNIAKLEQLVQSLEDQNISIDEAISRYSEGMSLAVECRKSMNEMTRKVNMVRQQAKQAMDELNNSDVALGGNNRY